jgi:hypothetical protein
MKSVNSKLFIKLKDGEISRQTSAMIQGGRVTTSKDGYTSTAGKTPDCTDEITAISTDTIRTSSEFDTAPTQGYSLF